MMKRIFLVGIWILASTGLCIGQWSAPVNVIPVNSAWAEVRPAVSFDGNTLYLSSDRPGGLGLQDIWESANTILGWQTPTNVGPPINTIYMDWLPSISSDGDSLYFLSDRPGGLGDYDMWGSKFVGGSWQPPVNLTVMNSGFTE